MEYGVRALTRGELINLHEIACERGLMQTAEAIARELVRRCQEQPTLAVEIAA